MPESRHNHAREMRMGYEIVVDAYTPEERAMGLVAPRLQPEAQGGIVPQRWCMLMHELSTFSTAIW